MPSMPVTSSSVLIGTLVLVQPRLAPVTSQVVPAASSTNTASSCRVFFTVQNLVWIGCNNLHLNKNLFLGKAHFGRGGVFVRGRTIAKCGNHRCGETFRLQPKNLVVLRAVESFHRTGVNAEQRG